MEYKEQRDEALCALAQSGDAAAEEELLLRHRKSVRLCARPLFLLGGDSEDLIQEGMLGLLRAIRRYDPDRGSSFSTYAELCMRSAMLTAIRSASARRHSVLNDSLPLDSLPEEDDPAGNPEQIVLLREAMEERMRRLRERLSPLEAEVYELYREGLVCGEIAQRLGRSQKSVDNAIQRIKGKME
jgi:RNA polymerase sporulation-specific sigma factor